MPKLINADELGENGREAMVPLEYNTSWAKDVAALIMNGMGGSKGGGSGDQSIRKIMDEREVGRAILRDWNKAQRQSGRTTTLKRKKMKSLTLNGVAVSAPISI